MTASWRSRRSSATSWWRSRRPSGVGRDGPRAVDAATVAAHPLILFEAGATLRRVIDGWFHRAGVAPRSPMELGNTEAIKKLVEAGLGWSVTSWFSVESEARAPRRHRAAPDADPRAPDRPGAPARQAAHARARRLRRRARRSPPCPRASSSTPNLGGCRADHQSSPVPARRRLRRRRRAASPARVSAQAPASAGPVDPKLIEDLVAANRILADQGVVDGYGHVSVRHPADPQRYLMSRSIAPELVTAADIMEYDLDSVAGGRARAHHLSRALHSRRDLSRPARRVAVVHNHSPSVIPFGVSTVPLRPLYHMSAFLGGGVPVFDIRKASAPADRHAGARCGAGARAGPDARRPSGGADAGPRRRCRRPVAADRRVPQRLHGDERAACRRRRWRWGRSPISTTRRPAAPRRRSAVPSRARGSCGRRRRLSAKSPDGERLSRGGRAPDWYPACTGGCS